MQDDGCSITKVKAMSREKKDKKFSPLSRLLGVLCTLLLFVSVIYVANAGIGYISGLIILASVAGLAGPAVATGSGFFEILGDILEMVVEGIQTIFEAILDIFSSIFG
jgi:hypothetical protein